MEPPPPQAAVEEVETENFNPTKKGWGVIGGGEGGKRYPQKLNPRPTREPGREEGKGGGGGEGKGGGGGKRRGLEEFCDGAASVDAIATGGLLPQTRGARAGVGC